MKIYIQWTTNPAQDWAEIDSSDWNVLLKKQVPVGGEIVDASLGYIYAINCQGVIYSGRDHYAVLDVPNGTIVGAWSDDIDDDPADKWAGDVTLFEPIQPDPAINNKMNTKQSFNVYAGTTIFERMENDSAVNVILKPFGDLIPIGQLKKYSDLNENQLKTIYSNRDEIRHGIWVSDKLAADHEAVRTLHGWREWI